MKLPRWLTNRRAQRCLQALGYEWENYASRQSPKRSALGSTPRFLTVEQRFGCVIAAHVLTGSRRAVCRQMRIDPKTLRRYQQTLQTLLAAGDGFVPPWGRVTCFTIDDLVLYLRGGHRTPPARSGARPKRPPPTLGPVDPWKLVHLTNLRRCADQIRRKDNQEREAVRKRIAEGQTLIEAIGWAAGAPISRALNMRLRRYYTTTPPPALKMGNMLRSSIPKTWSSKYSYVDARPLKLLIELIAAVDDETCNLTKPGDASKYDPLSYSDLTWALRYPETTVRDNLDLSQLHVTAQKYRRETRHL